MFAFWQIPIFVIFSIYLFILARSYGSSATIGFIKPEYNKHKDLGIVESSLLVYGGIDEHTVVAMILELQQLGFIHLVYKDGSLQYITKAKQYDPLALTQTQNFIYNHILFPYRSKFDPTIDEISHYQELANLGSNNLFEHNYIRYDLQKDRRDFNTKATLYSIPIVLIAFYVSYLITKDKGLMVFLTMLLIFPLPVLFDTTESKSSKYGVLAGIFLFSTPIYIAFAIQNPQQNSTTLTYYLSNPLIIITAIYTLMIFFRERIGYLTKEGLMAKRDLLGYKLFLEKTAKKKIKYQSDNDEYPYLLLFGLVKNPF